MAFDIVAASYRERVKEHGPLYHSLLAGATMGGVAVFMSAVGITKMFHERWIIDLYLTLGHTALLLCALFAGVLVARRSKENGAVLVVLQGAGAGLTAGAILGALTILISAVKLRFMFVALSKPLAKILTFDMVATIGRKAEPVLGLHPGVWAGVGLLLLAGAIVGALGALLYRAPEAFRGPAISALSAVGLIGLFQELITLSLQHEGILTAIRAIFFTWDGLSLQGAVIVAVAAVIIKAAWMWKRETVMARHGALPAKQKRTIRLSGMILGMAVIFLLPIVAGNFIGQVFLLVGLFVLMGYGLNLELGLCGLLDLGFVAFFAIGAYTIALLTADAPIAIASWSFWAALPVAVIMALIVGVIFGVPVLKVRGDYLAVATLGLGEIVRVLVLSDFAGPVFGGAQGILDIPRPQITMTYALDDPVKMFYFTLVCCFLVAYVSWRLQHSRLGRAWTAIRDDEDVAQALGINLINSKLLAYGIGAAFCGLAGAIFAAMLGSIFPHSFQLLISINILALIIIGGMGSLPGVVLGGAVLIGLPELLREFGEYRFFFYGLVIVVMMRIKAEGLWPSESVKRERRGDEDLQAAIEAELHGEGQAAAPAKAGE